MQELLPWLQTAASVSGCRCDVDQTCCCLVQVDAIHRKEAMKEMTEMFYAALFGYDEVSQATAMQAQTGFVEGS